MSIPWEEHYVYKLRQLTGGQIPLIVPGVRAVIRNAEGHFLFIERRSRTVSRSDDWGMPAGGMELGESIYDCLVRETKEETGLDVAAATLIAIYTGPKGLSEKHQMFEFCFRVDDWEGDLQPVTEETTDARFYPPDRLPPATNAFWTAHHEEVLADLAAFQGQLFLK